MLRIAGNPPKERSRSEETEENQDLLLLGIAHAPGGQPFTSNPGVLPGTSCSVHETIPRATAEWFPWTGGITTRCMAQEGQTATRRNARQLPREILKLR